MGAIGNGNVVALLLLFLSASLSGNRDGVDREGGCRNRGILNDGLGGDRGDCGCGSHRHRRLVK